VVSEALSREVRETARSYVFGRPEDNIGLLPSLATLLCENEHVVELVTVPRRTMKERAVGLAKQRHKLVEASKSESDRAAWDQRAWWDANGAKVVAKLDESGGISINALNDNGPRRVHEGVDPAVRYLTAMHMTNRAALKISSELLDLFVVEAREVPWAPNCCVHYALYGFMSNKVGDE
jgi:hypothetical protein